MSNDTDVNTSKVANFFSKNGWWYAAAAVMLTIPLGLVLIFALPDKSNGPDTTSPTLDPVPAPLSSPPPSPSQSPTATGWDDLGCNGTRGTTEVPKAAPNATWEPVGTLSAPTSESYGPTKVEGALRTCFQHTPAGALVAAANVLVTARTVPAAERAAVLAVVMTPGPGRDETIEASTPSNTGFRFAAFHVESCAPERCNIVLTTSIGSAFGYANVSMVWADGDWRLDGAQAPSGGSLDAIPAGYVTWGA